MATHVTLRYFDARARAQYLRYYLACREIPFDDDRVPLSADFAAWLDMRDDQTRTGPFKKLPVLHWDDRVIAESLVIRDFLHTACRDADALDAQHNLRHAMLASSLYNDVLMPVGILIWADRLFVGLDFAACVTRSFGGITRHLTTLDATLGEWSWLAAAGRTPLLTDCLLWESLDMLRHVFGKHFELDGFPILAEFYRDCPGRTVFERVRAERPCQVTGRPDEAALLDRIQQLPSVV